ncbi:hypothetical protein Dsin_012787 [Dipteronia sinensis]|uniref:Uncharacterized protein n=1 Tax=Dipteronia sinensis TaxID=43782 RepID=A0AAE0AK18_9ROSI|nr:hypothetical protein Dsin_012787 [Dipteronia sinensis]
MLSLTPLTGDMGCGCQLTIKQVRRCLEATDLVTQKIAWWSGCVKRAGRRGNRWPGRSPGLNSSLVSMAYLEGIGDKSNEGKEG